MTGAMRLRGSHEVEIKGYTPDAQHPLGPHLTMRLPNLLIYVEDRAAFDTLITALRRIEQWGDDVFGPPDDAFAQHQRVRAARIANKGH